MKTQSSLSRRRQVRRIQALLRRQASAAHAAVLARFFKTGPGEYGEGDRFLGLRVPQVRAVVRETAPTATHADAGELLRSPWHEERLCALLLWVHQFRKGDPRTRREIYDAYLASTGWINNWDLVDLSAEHVVGGWLHARSRRPLYRLARSGCLWERRIAILATFHFVRRGEFDDTLALAELLRNDEHDLMHKAVGWLLREVGKRDQAAEETFLRRYCRQLPRTMLRYAIERFPKPLRRRYLDGEV